MLWIVAASFAVIAGLGAIADHARARRRNIDRIGWVPWPLVMLLAMIGAAVAASIALKSR